MKEYTQLFRSALPASYSQVFFSHHLLFTAFLVLASFSDPVTGLCGLIAVLTAVTVAHVAGLAPLLIKSGYYTFNVLLLGLAFGECYTFNGLFLLLLIVASVLALFLTVWFSALMARYKLPFLSVPFVFCIWLMLLSISTFSPNLMQLRTAESFHSPWSDMDTGIQQALIANGFNAVVLYFKALSNVFFQNGIIAGILISIGLLIYSRISFSLSIIGFAAGLFFFHLFYPGAPEQNFNWLSFNFVLSAVALGIFLIPSGASYVLVIVASLITSLLISALGVLVHPYFLPLYSLPFSLCVMLLIAVLNNRYVAKHLHLVQYQQHSPEKNLYTFSAAAERFKKDTYIHIHLPFYGEWKISQGHSGTITHKDDWRYAWDFVVADESGSTSRKPHTQVSDFYCYSLPVTAPADGQVILIEDGIGDNAVGDMDLQHNWGNAIVIKHAEGLYSKLTHMLSGSFKVKSGDYVKKGDLLALCGNSGRSPQPHIHFQLQALPHIGAPTLRYPLSYYIKKEKNTYTLQSFDYPEEGETVIRPTPTALLQQAFHFIPGMKLEFEVQNGSKKYKEQWEVFTDSSNFSYFYCARTASVAYFTNNETLFYFNSFSGDTDSLLYHFYCAAYKISLSYFRGLAVWDVLPVSDLKSAWKPLQDIIAPFHIFMRSEYKAVYTEADNDQLPKKISIDSEIVSTGIRHKHSTFRLTIENNTIKTITLNEGPVCITAVNTSF